MLFVCDKGDVVDYLLDMCSMFSVYLIFVMVVVVLWRRGLKVGKGFGFYSQRPAVSSRGLELP